MAGNGSLFELSGWVAAVAVAIEESAAPWQCRYPVVDFVVADSNPDAVFGAMRCVALRRASNL